MLGELKYAGVSVKTRTIAGVFVATCIWLAALLAFDGMHVWWLLIFLPSITLAAEYPRLRVIDDNGMMTLIPLVAILVFQPFF